MKETTDEDDVQFLHCLRIFFYRISPAMADSATNNKIIQFTLRKHIFFLWARVEAISMVEFSSRSLESIIELAAQAPRVDI